MLLTSCVNYGETVGCIPYMSKLWMDNMSLYITIEQFGFRKGHSTKLAVIQIVDRLTIQMDLGNVPINIYIDLSKEFDILDHSILLDKLNYYGICGVENLMYRTYLPNRH